MDTAPIISKCKDELAEKSEKIFLDFLYTFRDVNDVEPHYREPIKRLRSCERNTLFVDFSHLLLFNSEFANNVQLHFHRLYPSLCRALRTAAMEYCKEDIDVSRFHYKEFYVSICTIDVRARLRELGTNIIGVLVCVSGQVVRTHPVHPELHKGSFVCDMCSTITRDIEQQFRYTQPVRCSNMQCQNRTKFELNIEESNFIDFQKVRIQETQMEIPRGAIPLSLDVIVRGELVETVQPGDRCDFIGTLIVIPDVSQLSAPGMKADVKSQSRGRFGENDGLTGLKALGVRDLSYKLAFLACNVCPIGQSSTRGVGKREERNPETLWEQLDAREKYILKKMSDDRDIASNLINSLFPEIYGHEEVKLGVLLMLFGGVTKSCPGEGTNLRGDINICLIGDPSTAKSQILKTVEHFSPRAVYTSGKASSAAGLTAAVVKDEESFEFVIEAGALMLADNGVCCIDEFDKMDLRDQIAIHEAMEQQTISITKAGVKATLNARASILAAANPVGGRYDRSRPLKYNIQLSAPIMSRFDLFFVMIDQCNEVTDHSIAKRIVQNHRSRFKNEAFPTIYEYTDIQKYIAFARCFKPKISEEAKQFLVGAYKKLRMEDSNNSATSSWRITVRQLESLIRLSEALARLHCDDLVREDHVRQSFFLLSKSIIRVDQPDIALDDHDELRNVNMDVDGEHGETAARRILGERNLDDSIERLSESLDTQQISQDKPVEDAPPTVINIKFETYKKIADMLVLHIRRDEDEQIENENWQGVPESQLIQWYLDMIEDTLETEEDLITQRTICRRIIKRLIYDDQILIHTNADEADSDPTLVVHPNYVVSDE